MVFFVWKKVGDLWFQIKRHSAGVLRKRALCWGAGKKRTLRKLSKFGEFNSIKKNSTIILSHAGRGESKFDYQLSSQSTILSAYKMTIIYLYLSILKTVYISQTDIDFFYNNQQFEAYKSWFTIAHVGCREKTQNTVCITVHEVLYISMLFYDIYGHILSKILTKRLQMFLRKKKFSLF